MKLKPGGKKGQKGKQSNANYGGQISKPTQRQDFVKSRSNCGRTSEGSVNDSFLQAAAWCGFFVGDRMDMPFELLLLVYSVIHLLLQNYNVYRTNFLDVDCYAISFSLVALLRRFVWKQAQEAFKAWSESWLKVADQASISHGTSRRVDVEHETHQDLPQDQEHDKETGQEQSTEQEQDNEQEEQGPRQKYRDFFIAASNHESPAFHRLIGFSLILVVSIFFSVYCVLVLASRYPLPKVLFITTPAAAYFAIRQRLALESSDRCLQLHATDGTWENEAKLNIVTSRGMFENCCASIVYASLLNAFYVGVLPAIFVADDQLFWAVSRTRMLTVVVFCNTLILLSTRIMTLNLLEFVVHAQSYGYWMRTTDTAEGVSAKDVQLWKPGVAYRQGALVRFHCNMLSAEGASKVLVGMFDKIFSCSQADSKMSKAVVYKGLGLTNYSPPGDFMQAICWTLFSSPLKTQACVTLLQLAISLVLLFVAMQSVAWHATCLMVVSNYVLVCIALQAQRSTRLDKQTLAMLNQLIP